MPRAAACALCSSNAATWRTARAAGARSSIHGGLRYLATGQVGDRARERVGAAPAHDAYRASPRATRWRRSCRSTRPDTCRAAHTSASATGSATGCGGSSARRTPCCARRDRSAATRCCGWRPRCAADALRGGMRGWDGQLIDDARLVVAVARTAAGYGASILTRVEAIEADGGGALLRDRADRIGDPRARPRRAQRHGSVGGRARPGGAAAPEPRHAPRRRCRAARRIRRVADRPGARVVEPVRLHAARAPRSRLHRADRRAGRSTSSPTCRRRRMPRSTCSSTRSTPCSPRRSHAPT